MWSEIMTKDDWRYLIWFVSVTAAFLIAMVSGFLLLAILFGIIVVLFSLHMILNLLSALSRNDALELLKKIESAKDNDYVLSVEKWGSDYSEWDAFCDTPIIADRLLNKIRVKCHALRSTSIAYGKSIDSPARITESAINEIGSCIKELEMNEERV